jgi:hypothetical protein
MPGEVPDVKRSDHEYFVRYYEVPGLMVTDTANAATRSTIINQPIHLRILISLDSPTSWKASAGWCRILRSNPLSANNAEISRAVVELLPPSFMHRERIRGDLASMIVDRFPRCKRVQDFMKRAMSSQTALKSMPFLTDPYSLLIKEPGHDSTSVRR